MPGERLRGYSLTSILPLCLVLASCTTQPDDTAGLAPLESQAPMHDSAAAAETEQTPPTRGQTAENTSTSSPSHGSSVTLQEAVRKALSWHPSIDEAVGRLNQRTQEIAVARAGYLPQVSGGIRSVYDSNHEDIRPKLTVAASQMVYDFGKVSSSVKAETAGVEVVRAQLLMTIDNVIRDTAYAFVETQRYRALLDVAEDQMAGVEAIAKLVRRRSDGGASTRSDEVQAEARVQAARSRVLEISAQLSRWQTTLASLTGSAGSIRPDENVPAWLLRVCETSAPDWSRLPATMRAEAEQKEAAAQLQHSRAQIFPTVSLEADAAYDLNGSDGGITGVSDDPDFTVGLNVSGKLYDGGATLARRDAAGYALKAADAARENARVEALQALTNARNQTANMKQLLTSLSSRSDMMRETRDLYRRQYVDLGTRTLLDLLNAEQELHQAQFDIANTRHDLRRLNIDCLFNSGTSRSAFALDGMTVRGVSLRP